MHRLSSGAGWVPETLEPVEQSGPADAHRMQDPCKTQGVQGGRGALSFLTVWAPHYFLPSSVPESAASPVHPDFEFCFAKKPFPKGLGLSVWSSSGP